MSEGNAVRRSTARPLALDKLGADLINDNSKRSVSIRINTSDFGRIKAVSRRLKVRESDVFRFLVKVGLAEVAALCDSGAGSRDLLGVFAAHGRDLVGHFNLNARRLEQVINGEQRGDPGGRVEADDLELIALSVLPERYLALRLQELLGRPVAPELAQDALRDYLEGKYLAPPPPAQAGEDVSAA
jgi:hypothetical protein